MHDRTNIEVSQENWRWLNSLKKPGDSFNDVLNRLREQHQSGASGTGDERPHLPDDLDLPGSGDRLQERRAMLADLYRHLQEHGTATKTEFLELVEPERVGYASAESFWANCIKGRDSLRALPGVEPPDEGEHTWRYVGEYD